MNKGVINVTLQNYKNVGADSPVDILADLIRQRDAINKQIYSIMIHNWATVLKCRRGITYLKTNMPQVTKTLFNSDSKIITVYLGDNVKIDTGNIGTLHIFGAGFELTVSSLRTTVHILNTYQMTEPFSFVVGNHQLLLQLLAWIPATESYVKSLKGTDEVWVRRQMFYEVFGRSKLNKDIRKKIWQLIIN